MSKGFIWVCQNNSDTDYVRLSVKLAQSIKKHNKIASVCVVTDSKTKISSKDIDLVLVMNNDDSKDHAIKWANEHKLFSMSPFVHTIKLAADMIWNDRTDWWWNFLWQHNMVFSLDCYNYKNEVVKNKTYRPFHDQNNLQNIYSDLTYFRKSKQSVKFGEICRALTHCWEDVKTELLINCHDRYPSTDIIYALAQRITDPLGDNLIDYPWFKIIHNKKHVNGLISAYNNDEYLMPTECDRKIIMGGYVQTRPLHYVNKNFLEELNARVF